MVVEYPLERLPDQFSPVPYIERPQDTLARLGLDDFKIWYLDDRALCDPQAMINAHRLQVRGIYF